MRCCLGLRSPGLRLGRPPWPSCPPRPSSAACRTRAWPERKRHGATRTGRGDKRWVRLVSRMSPRSSSWGAGQGAASISPDYALRRCWRSDPGHRPRAAARMAMSTDVVPDLRPSTGFMLRKKEAKAGARRLGFRAIVTAGIIPVRPQRPHTPRLNSDRLSRQCVRAHATATYCSTRGLGLPDPQHPPRDGIDPQCVLSAKKARRKVSLDLGKPPFRPPSLPPPPPLRIPSENRTET